MFNKHNLLHALLILLLCQHQAIANTIASATTNQNEQDKARQAALTPQHQAAQASQINTDRQTLTFPEEENCRLINNIYIDSAEPKLTHQLLDNLTAQALHRCLGINGIQHLAMALQNELIARGYITSLVTIPEQSLAEGTLRLELAYGKIGEILWSTASEQTTSIWNNIPASKGDILRLSDLEQGMENLRRLPGSSANMQILPGQREAESNLQLTRRLDKKWQVGAWMDDAGSRASGRYQAGGALYLYDITTLNDIFYVSGGGDIEFNQHNDGNQNGSLYYSIPFGYWALSLYGSQSQYRQLFKGAWSQTDYKSKNRYYSATLSRLLSHTRQQQTSLDLRIAKSSSHYYFGGEELGVMRKQNPTWELTLRQQRYFDKKVVAASLGLQRRLPWLSSVATPEEKAGLFSKRSRVVHADLQALMKFDVTGDKFSYAPHVNAQYSPDILSSDNQFNIGNRWTVRGFDGEYTLSGNQGWYWSNDFIWDIAGPEQQFYLGLDIGRIIGSEQYRQGKVISGAVSGLRGKLLFTQYDLFIGTPLSKPDNFQSDSLNLGFALKWKY
ncbi:ShlB/FhaC/HecB family hemolysin secretion/activation protein [Klebsiella aerogenes]|uniref:ShlB/FhaC/HecB family hemolysin secretion/activation protein n=1 Tax=Klebsiella TaxID=570 RepID=UPI001BCFD5D1|nr:ShlB/FhaC/HecB family hemolysin secretion/activation protein [Klebsiella aerogenes]EKZ9669137.1 ShlB/FhaC/HecB family hemolysin secretion/activation protein [Klebsiella aerogenes]MDQ8580302.1 ShlB/FhaC/HecB family hemolysin secretion/activation protein [Klebsiella aerogenes]HBS5676724.1 ShlB/FhaC/HecB family hemolysin secretion/activation protein [Klebsiella aerogenes]HCR0143898.1 ShlB/FhaC/HecB family hemolysin secretion/activation protein [Klebsiella aerogenes]HCU2332049.1 ShlB/FhaC/HecB 